MRNNTMAEIYQQPIRLLVGTSGNSYYDEQATNDTQETVCTWVRQISDEPNNIYAEVAIQPGQAITRTATTTLTNYYHYQERQEKQTVVNKQLRSETSTLVKQHDNTSSLNQ